MPDDAERRRRRWGWWVLGIYLGLGLTAWAVVVWQQDDRSRWQRVWDWRQAITQAATAEDLPVDLVMAVVLVESGGRKRVASHKEAIGLMQVREIARRDVRQRRDEIGGGELTDPYYNLQVGCAFLRIQLDRFDQDLVLALAAYNAGPTKVAALRRKYPKLSSRDLVDRHAPRETRAYYRKVIAARDRFQAMLTAAAREPVGS